MHSCLRIWMNSNMCKFESLITKWDFFFLKLRNLRNRFFPPSGDFWFSDFLLVNFLWNWKSNVSDKFTNQVLECQFETVTVDVNFFNCFGNLKVLEMNECDLVPLKHYYKNMWLAQALVCLLRLNLDPEFETMNTTSLIWISNIQI